MQNHYGKAIRENKGYVKGMQKNIGAFLNHVVKNKKLISKKQHTVVLSHQTDGASFGKTSKIKLPSIIDYLQSLRKNSLQFLQGSQMILLNRGLQV